MADEQAGPGTPEVLRRLDALGARIDSLGQHFDVAVQRASQGLYSQTEAALDEIARHLDALTVQVEQISTTVNNDEWSDSHIDAEVRARLVQPPQAVDTGAIAEIVQDELRRVMDSVATVAREIAGEATRLREQQQELTTTLAERDREVQRTYVDLIVAALDETLGGLSGRQQRRMAKELESSFGQVARRSAPAPAPDRDRTAEETEADDAAGSTPQDHESAAGPTADGAPSLSPLERRRMSPER